MSDDVALVSLEVVQYRSGARQDIKAINDLVKSYGALMLWDAAHAVGSVVMDFDKNGVDAKEGFRLFEDGRFKNKTIFLIN